MTADQERDAYFADPHRKPFDFQFTAEVAGVFDDMVSRSVPFYHEMQRMTAEFSSAASIPSRRRGTTSSASSICRGTSGK